MQRQRDTCRHGTGLAARHCHSTQSPLFKNVAAKGGTAFNLCFEEAPTCLSVTSITAMSASATMLASGGNYYGPAPKAQLSFSIQGHALQAGKFTVDTLLFCTGEPRGSRPNYLWRIPLARRKGICGNLENLTAQMYVRYPGGTLYRVVAGRSAPRTHDIGRFSELAGEIIRMSHFARCLSRCRQRCHIPYTHTHMSILPRG